MREKAPAAVYYARGEEGHGFMRCPGGEARMRASTTDAWQRWVIVAVGPSLVLTDLRSLML